MITEVVSLTPIENFVCTRATCKHKRFIKKFRIKRRYAGNKVYRRFHECFYSVDDLMKLPMPRIYMTIKELTDYVNEQAELHVIELDRSSKK